MVYGIDPISNAICDCSGSTLDLSHYLSISMYVSLHHSLTHTHTHTHAQPSSISVSLG